MERNTWLSIKMSSKQLAVVIKWKSFNIKVAQVKYIAALYYGAKIKYLYSHFILKSPKLSLLVWMKMLTIRNSNTNWLNKLK